VTPAPGEVWLADAGDEQRHRVYVISELQFQRLGSRAIIAPVIDPPAELYPWHIAWEQSVIATNLIGSTPIARLLERIGATDLSTLRSVRRAARAIVG